MCNENKEGSHTSCLTQSPNPSLGVCLSLTGSHFSAWHLGLPQAAWGAGAFLQGVRVPGGALSMPPVPGGAGS